MANRITLPGILGAAAAEIGVSALAKEGTTTPRTLYNWATNRSPTPAIPALRLAAVCNRLHLKPLLYLQPGGGPRDFIASTPQGWLYAPLGEYGPVRYHSLVEDPQLVPPGLLAEAAEFGWPWLGPGRTKAIPVWVDLDTAYSLHHLLTQAQAIGTLQPEDGVDQLFAYVADRLEEGVRRPGSWEAQVVTTLFGL